MDGAGLKAVARLVLVGDGVPDMDLGEVVEFGQSKEQRPEFMHVYPPDDRVKILLRASEAAQKLSVLFSGPVRCRILWSDGKRMSFLARVSRCEAKVANGVELVTLAVAGVPAS